MNLRHIFLAISAAFVSSAGFSACVNVDYPSVAFRCEPSEGNDACPSGYFCCSDDPAAYDVSSQQAAGVLPDYNGAPGSRSRVPMFSENLNVISRTGMCVSTTDIIEPQALAGAELKNAPAVGCPVPCNPTWNGSQVAEVCGVNTSGQTNLCCQTAEMDYSDCVFDQGDQCFRPVTGADAFANDVLRVDTNGTVVQGSSVTWSPGEHATMQSPGAVACAEFSAAAAANSDTARDACYRALSVANQRGFCLNRSDSVTACPLASANYIDACEELNSLAGLSACPG